MQLLKQYSTLILFLTGIFAFSQETLKDRIDSILEPYLNTNSPGLSIRVVKGDSVLYSKGLGIANLNYDVKNTDSTIFSIASIAKQFTAAAIWSLIQENKLSLEDNVKKYLPNFPSYNKPVKIKHLLNHTSGIRNYHTLMFLSGFDYDKDYYDNTTVFEIVKRQKNLNNMPGEKVIYSNTNFNLLALIIEKISEQNLDEYLKRKILIPLRMKNTFVRVSNGNIIKNLAVGYKKKDSTYIFNVTNQLSYGAGSMGSNVKDLSVWINLLNGNIVEFKELTKFLTTQENLPNAEKANYARGVIIDNYKGYKTIHHSGYGFGGQSQIITLPEENLGVVIMTNLQSINPTPISYKILDLLIKSKNQKSESTNKKTQPASHNLKQFTGDYKEINSDMKMVISLENDSLRALGSMGNSKITLVSYAENVFLRETSQNVKYDFTKTLNHDLVISFGGVPFYFKRAKFLKDYPKSIEAYLGNYYSEELQVTYTFYDSDGKLKLSYLNNEDINLYPIQVDEFGNNDRTLYHFQRDIKGGVIGMLLSCDGQVSNIEFVKN